VSFKILSVIEKYLYSKSKKYFHPIFNVPPSVVNRQLRTSTITSRTHLEINELELGINLSLNILVY